MAQGRRRARSGGAAPGASDADRIIDAAMTLIASGGWRNLSLAAVAEQTGLTVLQVYRIFPSRTAILCGFFRRIDEAALAAPVETETGERPRDRVFDLLMRRFDALQPYRAPLTALRRDLPFDPLSALVAGAALLCSMRLTLETAGISCDGIGGVIAVKLVAAAYLFASQTWARDESPDLAPTMAVLDRRLRGIERFLVPRRRAGERGEAAA
ncbi:MAG TPA: helix-turn-helix domain-containing protein [Stellaceae bacterium]|nr:helix-turn-helix domain-containing protein [Stellaceae bacterium]